MSPDVSSRSAPLAVQRILSTLAVAAALAACLSAPAFAQGDPFDASTLTKFVDPLPIPVPIATVAPNKYEIGAWPVLQKLHRDLPATHLYGYGPTQATATFPGMTIMATRGVPTTVHWTNHIPLPHILGWAVDPTIGQAQVTTGVPIAPHVHGGEQEPQSDGGAFTWFTPNFAEKGPDWKHETYVYANRQQAATIWYHDHAFGYTRFNPYAGLAGFYILRDPKNEPNSLPAGKYDIPIVIQDKDVFPNGDLWYPTGGDNPWIHPLWVPEAFFNMIVVNGKAWPYLNVEQHGYRFRFLDGSNARFYSLALVNRATGAAGPAFVQIAGDGGYLPAPATLNQPKPNSPRLLIAPGERAEVVIDFRNYPVGTELLLTNTAFAPYPTGDAPDPNTTGQIMLFKVVAATDKSQTPVPGVLNHSAPKLSNPVRVRQLTLNETEGPNGPIGMYLNGHEMMDPATEKPTLGTTEQWDIVNTTMDAHPIHLHLVQMQLLNRQAYNAAAYMNVYEQANPVLPTANPVEVPVGPYLLGTPNKPDPNETGWKDTFRMNPGEVTRLLIRFAPQDNTFGNTFAFDATASPGYVWHCHILEHEENDMMRPLLVQAAVPAPRPCPAGLTAPATDDNGLGNSPKSLELRAAPNPVRNAATLSFTLPTATHVDLRIYDVTGREVGVLADGTFEAGIHPVTWNPRDTQGRALASGIYFARLRAQNGEKIQRLIVAP